MKLHILVQRDDTDPEGVAWAEEVVDEGTMDEWNGRYPDSIQRKIDADPANFRWLIVNVPDTAYDGLWNAVEITGTVS